MFDIDLGLGLPFLIFTLVRDQPVSLLSISEWVRKYIINTKNVFNEFIKWINMDYFIQCIFNSIQRETKIVPHAKFGLVLLGILLIVIILFAKIKFQ